MADVVTFDPINLIISEISTGGDNELDIVEIYSEWKVWVSTGENGRFPIAFRYVGADPISQTRSLGSTFFILNGWRLRPAELDHRLVITGNVYTDPAGSSIIVPTLGGYTVPVELSVSNLIDVIETGVSGLTSEEAQWLELAAKVMGNKAIISADDQTVTIYDDDQSTPLYVWTISPDKRTRIPT